MQTTNLLEQGSVVTLTNNREYIIFATVEKDNKNFAYLMSTAQPVEIRFVEQSIVNGQIDFRNITDQQEKIALLELFKLNHSRQKVLESFDN